jgi:Rrf2 family transcriptional regulator, nitric oxide-sensitive transcriptional repressor
MRLQKATRFALYAVLELASCPERHLSAAEVASKYGISLNHLAKVLRTLGRSGMVEASRGVGGGYRFTGNAKRTTLLDVIQLFESIDPITAGEREPGEATAEGVTLKSVLEEIEDTARATLSSISLDTMLKLTRRQAERRARGTDQSQPATLAR